MSRCHVTRYFFLKDCANKGKQIWGPATGKNVEERNHKVGINAKNTESEMWNAMWTMWNAILGARTIRT